MMNNFDILNIEKRIKEQLIKNNIPIIETELTLAIACFKATIPVTFGIDGKVRQDFFNKEQKDYVEKNILKR